MRDLPLVLAGLERRSLISEERLGLERVVISYAMEERCVSRDVPIFLQVGSAYLKRLRVPILHALYTLHIIQSIR